MERKALRKYVIGCVALLCFLLVFQIWFVRHSNTNTSLLHATAQTVIALMMGILPSWAVTYFFIRHKSDLEQKQDRQKELMADFKEFFRSLPSEQCPDDSRNNTVIVLPGFYALNGQAEERERVISRVDNDIKEAAAGGLRGSRRSIKDFRESAAFCFVQADTIGASSVIAEYARMGMALPAMRSDVQALIKFFQFDRKQDDKLFTSIYEEVKKLVSKEEFDKYDRDGVLKKMIKSCGSNIYTTNIVIGMYSNIFMMDLLNDNDDQELEEEKHFAIYFEKSSSGEYVRRIFIRDNTNRFKGNATDDLPFDEADMSDNNYCLIARVNWRGRTHLIAAGVSAHSTELAAEYLMCNWKKIYDIVGTDSFAMLVDAVERTIGGQKIAVKDSQPVKQFPASLALINKQSTPKRKRVYPAKQSSMPDIVNNNGVHLT